MALTLLRRFRLLAPAFKGAPDSKVQDMLEVAEEYRPSCLAKQKQDEAVVFYAAYLLSLEEYANNELAQDAAEFRRAGITSEKEGDLSRSYAKLSEGFLEEDPQGFYARWKALNDICKRMRRGGSACVGNSDFERSLPQGFRREGW